MGRVKERDQSMADDILVSDASNELKDLALSGGQSDISTSGRLSGSSARSQELKEIKKIKVHFGNLVQTVEFHQSSSGREIYHAIQNAFGLDQGKSSICLRDKQNDVVPIDNSIQNDHEFYLNVVESKGQIDDELSNINSNPEVRMQRSSSFSEALSRGPKRKRNRRKAAEIERIFRCTGDNCNKQYGSENALRMHIKLKHPEFGNSKTLPRSFSADSISGSPSTSPTSGSPTFGQKPQYAKYSQFHPYFDLPKVDPYIDYQQFRNINALPRVAYPMYVPANFPFQNGNVPNVANSLSPPMGINFGRAPSPINPESLVSSSEELQSFINSQNLPTSNLSNQQNSHSPRSGNTSSLLRRVLVKSHSTSSLPIGKTSQPPLKDQRGRAPSASYALEHPHSIPNEPGPLSPPAPKLTFNAPLDPASRTLPPPVPTFKSVSVPNFFNPFMRDPLQKQL